MGAIRTLAATTAGITLTLLIGLQALSCSSTESECTNCGGIGPTTSTGGTGGSGANGGSGATTAGGGGAGGAVPCGGACEGDTPYCDEGTSSCVACLETVHCTDPAAPVCDGGSCTGCTGVGDCERFTDEHVCTEEGHCVECTLEDQTACDGTATCDLLAESCTGAEAGTVGNCEACTNDSQCVIDHRCVEMQFDGSAHGYYCLEEYTGACDQPFAVLVNAPSLNGVAAADYCGIEQDIATCEAVLALLDNWRCSGTDGMCSPDGIEPEVAVPGAVCHQVGTLPNRCTYACGQTQQCPPGPPINTCGEGDQNPPGWCGG